jgi:hypothetical protein
MQLARFVSFPAHSSIRRIVGASVAVLAAAAIAAGCGGSSGSGGGDGQSGIVGDDGPLAWLPADTWLVASANVDPTTIDTAVKTLGRLPIWSLAEGFLPASDGAGLRRTLLEQVAKSANGSADRQGRITAKQLETAFGNRLGVAITDNDFAKFDSASDAPVVGWIDVDDKDAADKLVHKLASGKITTKSHHGVDYYVNDSASTAILLDDDRMFFAANTDALDQVIDVHEGDHDSLADDDTGRAVIEASIGDAFGGVAIQTDPVLAGIPDAIREGAKGATGADAARAKAIARDLGPLLRSRAVDGLVPDWLGASLTIDSTGVRARGAWSNPRDLATPKVGSRELLERMPADAPTASASVSDGTMIARVQHAWGETKDTYDLDLRALAKDDCEAQYTWACNLGVELALTALEDTDLADASTKGGDRSLAYVQDLAPLLSMAAMSEGTGAAPKLTTPKSRIFEVAQSGDHLDWTPPRKLTDAAKAAGIVVTAGSTPGSVNVRVVPNSPIAKLLVQHRADAAAAFGFLGIDIAKLQSAQGVTLAPTDVDGIQVFGLPVNAPSKVEQSLGGDADQLGDSDHYRATVKAANPPKHVGAYSYIDLPAYVDSFLTALGTSDESVKRIGPTVQNNLSNVPGILSWTTRETVRDHEVGVYETVMPITD